MGSDASAAPPQISCCRMPVGTVISDFESGEVIADLTHDGERALLAKAASAVLAIFISNPAPIALRASSRTGAGFRASSSLN